MTVYQLYDNLQEDIGDDWPIETVGSGGQPMTKQFTKCIGKMCKQCTIGYGGTEPMITSSIIINNPDEFEDFCCGKNAAGISTKIVDEVGEIVPVNTRGEILIKSKYVFKEYYNDPEKTKACFTSDGWYKSDDIGFIKEDGNLFCVGRKSDMIISGGMNVAPSILEATIAKNIQEWHRRFVCQYLTISSTKSFAHASNWRKEVT